MRRAFWTSLAAGLALAASALAEPTPVMVHVIAKGAKFVGSGMGGVRVVLRDAQTREILAQGVTYGGTGDTARIMTQARRGDLADAGSAGFLARLDLSEPRLVELEAYGPLAQPQAAVTVTSQQWIVPGRAVTGGDGWTVELPGLAVRVEGPTPHSRLSKAASTVDVRAHVAPLCGCPIDAGGTWDAAAYVVEAVVRRDGKEVSRTPLPFAGATGEFGGPVPLPGAGTFELIVYAWDGRGGSTGLDRTTVVAP